MMVSMDRGKGSTDPAEAGEVAPSCRSRRNCAIVRCERHFGGLNGVSRGSITARRADYLRPALLWISQTEGHFP
jgi:hypothetical protein